ncbi:unnamed protein product [Symbiodinium sp. CCMP2456]|nr:unnamed protein product [Symbiodinium sp. CCMP2456]
MGRMSLGSTEYVLEIGVDKQEDPSFTIINQHFRFLHKLLVKWNQGSFVELEEAWQHWYNRIIRHKEPWRIVVGPFGAAACYLKALGWTATSLTKWRGCGFDFDILDRASLHGLSYHLKKTCDGWRWKAISQSEDGQSLANGVEWQAPRRALKQVKGLQKKALVAVWQGAIRHSMGSWCSRCNQEATLRHVLWDCSWWAQNQQEPEDFPRLRQEYQDDSLWLRGLPAAQDKPLGYTQVFQETGVFQQQELDGGDLHFATDGSPGGSQDPRFQVVTWGVVAFRILGSQIQVVGTATGPVTCEQTVFRAEAKAITYLVAKVQGNIEVALDAKGVKQLAERAARWKSEDLFQPVRAEMHRVTLTWINSHLTEQEYIAKFGADSLWRWQANEEVDRLVQNRANERREAWEQAVLIKDEVVIRVNSLLARRTAAMFQYDRLDGPQVVYPDSKDDNTPSQKKLRKGPKQTKLFKAQKQRKRKTQVAPPGEGKLNKRQQMEAMLDGARPALGHNWVVGHQSRDQLTIKCSTCGLYVQQTESITIFDRKINHHCLFQGPSFAMAAHATHKIVNAGKECRQRYQGKDLWVRDVIQQVSSCVGAVSRAMEAEDPGGNQGNSQAGGMPAEPASGSAEGPGDNQGNDQAGGRPAEPARVVTRNLPIPAAVLREKGKDPGANQGAGKSPPPPPPARKRTEAEEYSYYTGEEESAEAQEPSKRERFVATVRAAAKERQQGSVARPSPGDDQEMVEPPVENLPPVKEETTQPETSKARPQDEAKSPSSSTGESSISSSSSETEGPGQQPEQRKSPGDNQETNKATEGTSSFAKAKAPPPGIPMPGADQDMEPRLEASSAEDLVQATSEVKEEVKGEASPEGPVVFRQRTPVRAMSRYGSKKALLRRSWDQSLRRTMHRRCSLWSRCARIRVTYTNCGEEAGVTSTPLQVLGLGGSRIVVVAPHQDNLVWKISVCPQERERLACRVLGAVTPTPVRAAGVHQMTEEGTDAAQEPKWVTMLECERLDPFPEPTDFLVIQALFTLCLIAKVMKVKDVGRYNLGIRELRPSVPGALRAVVFLDCNGWEPYDPEQKPVFPNKTRAQGFWNMVQSYDRDLKDLLRNVVDEHHADLESLTCALRVLARGRFDADTFDELMHILVQTQVLALTPEGRLGQPLLPDDQNHDLEPGKSWACSNQPGR